jgi:DNA-binding CsgD family transcriptional regulator/tetratricopeptide (TPR) repeat protein
MLLERESPLATLSEYATDARRGDGRVVLVFGEAGAGKSTLVEQFERDLPDATWAWGVCDGLFTPRPLGPLFDVADRLGGELLDLCRADAPRDQLFAALLRAVDRPGSLHVLVIEDVHWADEATIDLIRFLGRRVRGVPVLLLLTYRDDALGPADPLRVALGDLARQRSTRRIGMAPLTLGAVTTLAAGTGLDPAELHRLTGGNPFYVTELLDGSGPVPSSARDAVLARVASLGAEARELVEAGALTGNRPDLHLLLTVTGSTTDTVDEVLASGLLVGDGDALHFRHEIARLALEDSIAAHRRVDLHGRLLRALRDQDCDDDARLAFHAEGAGDGPAVLRHAVPAALRAAHLGAHREAAAQYERAFRHGRGVDDAELARLHDAYVAEVALLDRWDDAAAAGTRALELWRAIGDPAREGDTLRQLSQTLWRLCRGREAFEAAETAVRVLEPHGDSVELAWAYANLANHRMHEGDSEEAIRLARAAEEIARPRDEYALLSESLCTRACASSFVGRSWKDTLAEALDIAVAHELQPQAGTAWCDSYALYSVERRFDEAERFYVDGYEWCDDRDMGTFTNCLSAERTATLEKTGRWAESAALAEELLTRRTSPVNRLNPLINLGLARARLGEGDEWACLDEAARTADASLEPPWIVPVRLARAEAFWIADDLAAAAREAELAADVAEPCDPWDRGATAAWLARTGSKRRILGAVAAPFRLAGAEAARAWVGLGCPYNAVLALYDSGAETDLREALSIVEELGAVPVGRLIRRRMRASGIRSIPAGARAATRADPAGLTPRERDVLRLVRAGRTNAEIATQLYISAKTVGHHVSAVLAKLGTATRAEAAAEADRLGLVDGEK